MINRKWPVLLLLAAASAATVAVACDTTGPDANPRTNGCIGEACYDGSAAPPTDGGPGPAQDGGGTDGPVVITDPLAGISPLTATVVKGGFVATQGPVWIGGSLLFSDTISSPSTIYELHADNTTTPFRQPASNPVGNAVDPLGALVTCEDKSSSRSVVRSAATLGAVKTALLPNQFGGLPFNSPHDVIVRADGNIYFTDPSSDADAATPRQPKQSVFRYDPGGALSLVKLYDTQPSGIAVSPDGNKLYVVDGDPAANVVNVWSLAADGTASGEKKLADVVGGDGMAVDDRGNVYVAATAGVMVFDANGTGLGTIGVAEKPSNCTFGGADRKTLYITAQTSVYSIKLNVPGLP